MAGLLLISFTLSGIAWEKQENLVKYLENDKQIGVPGKYRNSGITTAWKLQTIIYN